MPQTLQILTNSANGFEYNLTPFTGGTSVTGNSGGNRNTTVTNLDSTNYTLTLTDPNTGSVLHNSTVNTTDTPIVYAQTVLPVDPATTGTASTPVVAGQANSQANATPINIIQPITTTETFSLADGEAGKYFTCQDARLYIGDVFIDENIYVQYTLQDNKIPLYSYRSRFYDAVAQGKSIVQGQIGLNFVSEGYLYTVLNEYKKLANNTDSAEQSELNNLVYTKNQILNRQASASLINQAATQSSQYDSSQLVAVNNRINQLVSNPNVSLSVAQTYATQTVPVFPMIGNGYSNALYQDVPFDLVLQLEGAQRSVTRRLEGCQLIANDQVIDTSGNTLSDGYSFIARRLR